MTKPIRVVQWGLGAMGSGTAKLMLEKEGLEIVGAICTRPQLVGKDLGEILGIGKTLGIIATDDPASVLDKEKVDIVSLATNSWVKTQMPSLRQIISAGINVVTIAEGCDCFGDGCQSGFVLDYLVIALTGGCHSVERIEASRVNDLSPYGPTVMETQGVGTTPEAFRQGVAEGTIVGHVGFPESIHMISEALGLGVDRIEEQP
jgi:2,4-diaminopentanoate dehydrogenase